MSNCLLLYNTLHLNNVYCVAAKATNPLNREADWEFIIGFCDQVNKELEGPQIAVRLLAHKIQSPQEKEALYALQVRYILAHSLWGVNTFPQELVCRFC